MKEDAEAKARRALELGERQARQLKEDAEAEAKRVARQLKANDAGLKDVKWGDRGVGDAEVEVLAELEGY